LYEISIKIKNKFTQDIIIDNDIIISAGKAKFGSVHEGQDMAITNKAMKVINNTTMLSSEINNIFLNFIFLMIS